MSEFHSFDRSEQGLQRLKEFLLRERVIEKEEEIEITVDLDTSMMLDQSFMDMLESRRKAKEVNVNDNKENEFPNSRISYLTHNDSTFVEESSLWRITNESFEKTERMCESLSHQNQTHDEATGIDKESAAIERLLDNINSDNEKAKVHFTDVTQINDVEAPSCLWDNTVSNESTFQTSPVKMIGMLRPSTILEESSESCESNSSRNSFKTAGKLTDITSTDQYETANETAERSSEAEKSKVEDKTKTILSGSRSDFDVFPKKTHTFLVTDTKRNYSRMAPSDSDCASESTSSWHANSRNDSNSIPSSSIFDDSLNIIGKPDRPSDFAVDSLNNSHEMKSNIRSNSPIRNNTQASVDSVISLSDEENEVNDNNTDLNQGFSMQETDSAEGVADNSIQEDLMNSIPEFNDTIEEMEYIMQHGMKYMQKTNTEHKPINLNARSPSPTIFSPRTPSTVIHKSKQITPHDAGRDNVFKKPLMSSGKKVQNKLLNPLKKHTQFDHVVSPIAAYIKNTPKVPITSAFRANHNVFESRAIRELDYNAKQSTNCNKGCPTLPRKAYVSAEYQHVVDNRKQVVMPGGEKIHRYLYTSKIPAVIRHEGKLKMNLPKAQGVCDRTIDNSLADLSIMSGDVSVHVLRDAKQK